MAEPDYQGFWDALPHAAMMAGRKDVLDAFRREYHEEIFGLLSMLHRIGLVGGATGLHPDPPKKCDLCAVVLTERKSG